MRLDLVNDDLCLNKGHSDVGEDFFQLCLLFFRLRFDLKLFIIHDVESAWSPRPPQASQVDLNFAHAVVKRVSSQYLYQDLLAQVEKRIGFKDLCSSLVNEFQTHFHYVGQVSPIGVVEQLQNLCNRILSRWTRIFYEYRSCLRQLLLRSSNSVLVCCLDQRYQRLRVHIHSSFVNELEKVSHNLRRNVGDANFSLVSFHKGAKQHLLEHLRTRSQDLPVGVDFLWRVEGGGVRLGGGGACQDDHVRQFLLKQEVPDVPRHISRLGHLVPEEGILRVGLVLFLRENSGVLHWRSQHRMLLV